VGVLIKLADVEVQLAQLTKKKAWQEGEVEAVWIV
jgi:hypothetical protein